MVFSSVTFLFYFLPFCLLLYFIGRPKNIALLIFSLFFYSWGEAEYVALLLTMCFVNYSFGIAITSRRINSRLALALGIAINLSFLTFFKYTGFLFETANSVAALFGWHYDKVPDVHLPLGISFFTFQAMSYLIDVYRQKAPAEKNPINVLLYISMFPQLIAGPIVRFHSIARELHQRSENLDLFLAGIKFFVIGLGQKILIANAVALPADQIFNLPAEMLNTTICWLGALCYTLQIYFDFWGYSNMAIGLGLFFGFHFPRNFNYPYISRSITEFWQRWHMTLSFWFRDYLYIPLGGNRKGALRTYFNLLVVFFICGLWHGASWTFVIWGLYHGGFMIIERLGFKQVLERTTAAVQHLYAMLTVIIGWVIFRAESLAYAVAYITNLAGFSTGRYEAHPLGEYLHADVLITIILGILFSVPWVDYLKNFIAQFKNAGFEKDNRAALLINQCAMIVALCLVMIMAAIQLASGTYNPFIYFRF